MHPTRLGRHGGALVKAAFWEEGVWSDVSSPAAKYAADIKAKKLAKKNADRESSKSGKEQKNAVEVEEEEREGEKVHGPSDQKQDTTQKVREHVDVSKSRFRNDPRPIEADCDCYTCKNHSRAYLHHLFKVDESIGGQLVTLHNVHFMNKMMCRIRETIETGEDLDDLEEHYVHPELKANIEQ